MKRSIFLIFFLTAITVLQIKGQTGKITINADVFKEIKTILTKDNGRLWGINIYGALMFVDPATRNVIANEQNTENTFTKSGELFSGRLDEKVIMANTAQNINGKNWTMVILPLPKDEDTKNDLIIHELFHNIQEKLNLKPNSEANSHLDNKAARIYMILEWNALLKAYIENGEAERIAHIRNALLFRQLRRLEYSGTTVNENCLELQEGLAEYTGVKLGIEKESSKIKYLSGKVTNAVKNYPSFIRSFAYVSGPLYGLLLDKSGKEWRNELNPGSDLGKLLYEKYSLKLESNPKAIYESVRDGYGFENIAVSENKREEKNNKIVDKYRKKFVTGPVLSLPNNKMQFQFNPSELVSLGRAGNVYPHLRVVDKWGVLTAEEGAVIASNYMSVSVTAPFKTEKNTLKGEGWELKLNEGWIAVPSADGSFTLKNETSQKK